MKLFSPRKASSNNKRQSHLMPGQEANNFRRSRTLTGSKASNVPSVNENKAQLKSERIKKHTRKKVRRARALFIAGAAVIVMCGYYAVSQYITTMKIAVTAPQPVAAPPGQAYQERAHAYLAARPGERFRVTLRSEDLTKYLQQQFPEIEDTNLGGSQGTQARLELTLRQPVARWQMGERQFFVDGKGEAFEKNYFAPPQVEVVDSSGVRAGKGREVLVSQGFLRFLGRLVGLINASPDLGRVTKATLPPATTREIDINLEGKNYFIKTHIDRDPAAEVEDLRRAVAYLQQRNLSPGYIDLRIEGKAFYR